MSDLLRWAKPIDGAFVKVGWFRRAPLMLVGYESGSVAVVYLAPDYRVESSSKIRRLSSTHPVEIVRAEP